MGIGNDIKPKRVYRYVPSNKRDDSNLHDSEHADDEKQSDEKLENLEDDFFHDYNGKKMSPKKDSDELDEPSGFLFQKLNAKNITWLLLIILAIIVVYQNKDSVVGMIKQKVGYETKTTNSNDEYYEGETSTNSNTNVNANVNTNASAPTTETPSAVSSDLSSISLQVLNGNGVSGSANEIATTLKNAGYNPVKTSNARKFTYLKTYIYYKTKKEAEANAIKDVLSGRECLVENSDNIVGMYDIIVVVGKK